VCCSVSLKQLELECDFVHQIVRHDTGGDVSHMCPSLECQHVAKGKLSNLVRHMYAKHRGDSKARLLVNLRNDGPLIHYIPDVALSVVGDHRHLIPVAYITKTIEDVLTKKDPLEENDVRRGTLKA
jgi:hypothetical protein